MRASVGWAASAFAMSLLLGLSVLSGVAPPALHHGTPVTGGAYSPSRVLPAPETAMLMREYSLPMPVTGGFPRGLYDITHDSKGYIWATHFDGDKIYRLTPASELNQSWTVAWEWTLPSVAARRNPTHIIVDEKHTCVWFTCTGSFQLIRLNWSNNQIREWDLSQYGMMPFDLVMEHPSGFIWFTVYNSTKFCRLNVTSNWITVFTFQVTGAPGMLAQLGTNGTHLYMTDSALDNLYEASMSGLPSGGVRVYPLPSGGGSWGVAPDGDNNVWVTQPCNELVLEQLAGSTPKEILPVDEINIHCPPGERYIPRQTLEIPITITPVTATEFTTPPNITSDPLAMWPVPTAPSRPLGIAVDRDGYAWFTEPDGDQIGVVGPAENKTWEYPIPTVNCLPSYITITPSEHVWFAEYATGKFGELFSESFKDVRVCPSLPPDYPPPPPGSIRWTVEPGAEIWVDAPSNGYDPSHHDHPEQGATNHLYAKVKNLGSVTATNILVKFYYHNMSLGFAQFIPLPPTAPSSLHWIYIGTAVIASLAPMAETDVYVNWTIGANISIHQCIGVQVTCPGDINLYDNIAYRNFIVVTASAGTELASIPLYITNTLNVLGRVKVGLSGVPQGWEVWVEPNDFYLEAGETRKLSLHIDIPATAQPGSSTMIEITGTINSEVTGRVWVQVDVLATSTITCEVRPTILYTGDVAYITGQITPARSGVMVTVHITLPSGEYYDIFPFTDENGTYSIATLPNYEPGTYTVTASWSGDGYLLGATSSAVTFTVILKPIITLSLDLLAGFGAGFGVMLVIALILRKR